MLHNAEILLQFKEKAPYERGFHSYLKEVVVPHLQELYLKPEFVAYRSRRIRYVRYIAVAALPILLLLSVFGASIGTMLIFLAIVAVMCLLVSPSIPHAQTVLLPFIAQFFGQLEYVPQIPTPYLHPSKEADLLPFNDKVVSLDGIQGTFHKQRISIENVIHRCSERDCHYTMVHIQLSKAYTGHTVFRADLNGIQRTLKDWAAQFLDTIRSKKRVHLESLEFEKRFDVYSTDQIEARTIFTPDVLWRLEEVERIFQASVQGSIHNNVFILLIHQKKRAFQFTGNYHYHTIQELHRILNEIHSILALVDYLAIHKERRSHKGK